MYKFQGCLYRNKYDLAKEVVSSWITANGANEDGIVSEYISDHNDHYIIREMYDNKFLATINPHIEDKELIPVLHNALQHFRTNHRLDAIEKIIDKFL